MKVDMSADAVTGRLRAMDDLWLLSVKLARSQPGHKTARRRTATRALQVYDSIRQILFRDWDPIGIANEPGPKDEYDAYIAPVYRILAGTRSESDIVERLQQVERDKIGVRPSDPQRLLSVARKLLALSVGLDLATDVEGLEPAPRRKL